MAEKKLQDQDVSEIDKALSAAKARKDAKVAAGESTASEAKSTTPRVGAAPAGFDCRGEAPAKPKMTEEEKAAKVAARDTERAARKTARDATRQEKNAAKLASKQPAHMRKVEKAAEKLGSLGQAATLLFNEATTNLTAAELAILASHIAHFNRVKATERALSATIVDGSQVEIVSGDPRFIGKTGTVVKAQRIRCYVNIPGANNRPVPGTESAGIYFFTSDCAPAAVIAAETTETDVAASA